LDECDVTQEWIDKACLDYSAKLEELDRLLKETKNSDPPSMADQVQPIKLASVPQQKAGEQSEQLKQALASATALTTEHGIHSAEARVAWETVEEIASASERNDALGGKLSADECLVDAAMDACAALNELNRVIDNKPN
jgi:CP12 domain